MSRGQLDPRCWDADTPGVVWTKPVETQEPRYAVISMRASTVRCSTPTHQLPQCTRLRQKSRKNTSAVGFHYIWVICSDLLCVKIQKGGIFRKCIVFISAQWDKRGPFVFTHNQTINYKKISHNETNECVLHNELWAFSTVGGKRSFAKKNINSHNNYIFLPWHQSGYRTGRPGCARFPSLWMRKYKSDGQRRFFTGARSRPQTTLKEPDNAFIKLERFQSEAGAGERAWLDPDSAADWLRQLTRSKDEEERRRRPDQIREAKLDMEIDQNFTSWCPETPSKMDCSIFFVVVFEI